jgi:predicted ATPase
VSRDGFFLRAESFFNAASYVDEIGAVGWYGGVSLHGQSHGESFLALAKPASAPAACTCSTSRRRRSRPPGS